MIVASFIFFLLIFLGIGVASVTRSQKTDSDYLMAGRNTPPWLVALSAAATANSGYMFIGQVGYSYAIGLTSIWLMVGWLGGDLVISFFTHRPLRDVAGRREVLSFGGLLAGWHGTDYRWLRGLVGLVTVILLGVYAAAQFKAGSKALHLVFGWEYYIGAIAGCAIVVAYCMAGGIRASIWTDAAQSFVMIGSMFLLLAVAVSRSGGLSGFIEKLDAVAPDYLSAFSDDIKEFGPLAPLLFVTGWMFAGFGVVGQPHIMVRFMALDDSRRMGRVRAYYYTWSFTFFLCSIGVGMAARVLLPGTEGFDPELALPTLASDLLPSVLIGLMLAGLFAATMSTADSQILSCSAAITRDLLPGRTRSHWFTKGTTLVVAAVALGIALWGGANVFTLVVIAWSVLAAGFAPLVIVYAFGGRPGQAVAILMVVGGVSVTLLWRMLEGGAWIYEVAPGMVAGFAIYALGRAAASVLRRRNDGAGLEA